jgi:NADPH:quinone reductase-like Zn-dependent oxidoreductase
MMSTTTARAPLNAVTGEARTMNAAVYDHFGAPDVVRLTEVPKPVAQDDEVLIRIRATTVTAADWRARSHTLPRGFGLMAGPVFGFTRPRHRILGTELSGDVESVGKNVTRFTAGVAVLAHLGARFGCHAQYRCMPESALVAQKPASLSYEEAAALSFGGLTALTFFKRAKLERGEAVLINGASGAVGTAAVQIAKHLRARVSAVCSGGNRELMISLGADEVFDYTKQDFTALGKKWDVIVDTAGTAPFNRSHRSLKERGRFLAVLGTLPEMLRAPWVATTSRQRLIAGPSSPTPADLRELVSMAERGHFKPVIGARFAFEQIAEAHRLVDTGHKRGNVVVTL